MEVEYRQNLFEKLPNLAETHVSKFQTQAKILNHNNEEKPNHQINQRQIKKETNPKWVLVIV